ncbi:ferrochelatase [Pimelobacter simplex]|uniref:Coproporphyrin III ferrochelatase n=1 Tax=Nocardioides simplex TaxID=2045 RepID=A0A0A1DIQ6_NOCSI|nr:ferrochelatase [Pimelobacter simplex]AIY17276.1 Ferrochelatase, protoheme ferro-lyase [Pimelobacter simplex]MCG8151505.1 ferrochelatase [Pimelobacter simplex]GEB13309.1 putative ferrochelatase [Pimelobacter simplex]SFM46603.1 ferrochelatase [Pimelobacter simplex]
MPNPDPTPRPTDPYDALLLLSFGGPERPEDVVPFLENVTRGRGIPRERLEEVGQHYFLFGGRSPINDQNKALIAAVEKDLAEHGLDLPVYWGNRNWAPFLDDTVAQMAADGVRRVLCLTTSAYSSWSSCRQYWDNIDAALAALPDDVVAPQIDKVRAYFNHPGFVTANTDGVLAALAELPDDVRDAARLVFVTHSIPISMSDSSGPEGGAYVAQHLDVAAVVAAEVAAATGVEHPHELVYCSRSGAPHIPWLEPDVNDRLEELAAEGAAAVVLIPVGFVSDHMEVVYDLDTEALATAERLGLPARRAASAGIHPAFVGAVRELVLERAAVERGDAPERPALGVRGPSHDRCPAGCCLGARTAPA